MVTKKEKAKAGEVNFYFKITMLQGKSPAAFFLLYLQADENDKLNWVIKSAFQIHHSFAVFFTCPTKL